MNAVERYLKNHPGENLTKIAARMGRPLSTISRPLAGQRVTSTRIADDFERATGGEVTAAEFLAICIDASRKRAA